MKRVKSASAKTSKTAKSKTRYKYSDRYKSFLRSPYWKATRKLALARDNYKCKVCGATKTLQVHHKTYEHLGTEHLHLRDIVTLCQKCHLNAGNRRRQQTQQNKATQKPQRK